jgi:hypothetical protein
MSYSLLNSDIWEGIIIEDVWSVVGGYRKDETIERQ